MATYFVDTSVLVKLFVSEGRSENARTILGGLNENDVFIASITKVEFVATALRQLSAVNSTTIQQNSASQS